MNKLKWTLMTLAIAFSICSAFATRPHFDCHTSTQYCNTGHGFMPAGVLGVDYFCEDASGVCTYYLVGNVYTGCQAGIYTPVPAKDRK